ncbi:hypothetical protein MKW98_025601 [Papaver atlanticum]|uniref:Uncharacterized protein n=1 Tax=Papaver atlanticum TaxID=357466 RepID=A0AAD4SEH3_9MAGN|nr:hypothetical protein MKW98_025601 [Papaver atlanticum]
MVDFGAFATNVNWDDKYGGGAAQRKRGEEYTESIQATVKDKSGEPDFLRLYAVKLLELLSLLHPCQSCTMKGANLINNIRDRDGNSEPFPDRDEEVLVPYTLDVCSGMQNAKCKCFLFSTTRCLRRVAIFLLVRCYPFAGVTSEMIN